MINHWKSKQSMLITRMLCCQTSASSVCQVVWLVSVEGSGAAASNIGGAPCQYSGGLNIPFSIPFLLSSLSLPFNPFFPPHLCHWSSATLIDLPSATERFRLPLLCLDSATIFLTAPSMNVFQSCFKCQLFTHPFLPQHLIMYSSCTVTTCHFGV